MFRYAKRTTALLLSPRTVRRRSLFLHRHTPSTAGIVFAAPTCSALFQCSHRSISSTSVLRRDRRDNPSITINKKLVELGKKKQWEELLELTILEQRNFNDVNCATVMSQLGRIRSFDKSDKRFVAFLEALASIIEKRGLTWIETRSAANIIYAIGKMELQNPSAKKILEWISNPEVAAKFVIEGDPQHVANVAWACAKLGFEAPNLFAEIMLHSKWLVKEGTPQAVANTAWACATLGYEAPRLFAEIEGRSKWLVQEGASQAVANTAWALATLGFEAPTLFAEIESHSHWLVEKGKPQEVVNTAWACATLGYEAPNLFAEIESQSKWHLEEWNPQDFANTAWACATLSHEAPNLFAEIERRSTWLVEEGVPQDVANTAWAFATLGFEAPNLFAEIERHSKWLVEEETPQGVANTAWAFATLGFDAPNLFAEIERHSRWLVEEGTPQGVANTAWAFATLGFDAPNLFAEIERHSHQLVEEGTPQEVANTAWAFATLGFAAPKLLTSIDQHLDMILKEGNVQTVTNICYAIAVLGLSKQSENSLAKLWDRAIEFFIAEKDFRDENLNQLSQTQMFAKANGINLTPPPETMTKSMEQVLKSEVNNTASRSSNKVSQLLRDIGFHHELEVSPDDSTISGGMLAIDMAWQKRKIAIEYDGDSHYLKALGTGELTSTENGATKAKRRYLQQLGWTVINLDYREYIRAQRESNEKQWLRKKLQAAGVQWSK